MIRVTYEDDGGVGSSKTVECDQFHHHEDSKPFVICLTISDNGDETVEKKRIHEDRVITTTEVRNDE